MNKNMALNSAIFGSRFSAKDIAEKIGKSSAWLSKVVNGIIQPKSYDKELLAKVLGVDEFEIFKKEDTENGDAVQQFQEGDQKAPLVTL